MNYTETNLIALFYAMGTAVGLALSLIHRPIVVAIMSILLFAAAVILMFNQIRLEHYTGEP